MRHHELVPVLDFTCRICIVNQNEKFVLSTIHMFCATGSHIMLLAVPGTVSNIKANANCVQFVEVFNEIGSEPSFPYLAPLAQ